ncbi:hypothetical protein CAEBREN_29247 [Caenorhabditis brenneri]|uniref:Uncharacterized protein n=1 Tax=Caenorhabditis brenneri TaxID=135651 RepID=G0NEF0_CAEBE|nr:hypothetical protein CAEBREN_29247 [Caenorhabditis brenneri]
MVLREFFFKISKISLF